MHFCYQSEKVRLKSIGYKMLEVKYLYVKDTQGNSSNKLLVLMLITCWLLASLLFFHT